MCTYFTFLIPFYLNLNDMQCTLKGYILINSLYLNKGFRVKLITATVVWRFEILTTLFMKCLKAWLQRLRDYDISWYLWLATEDYHQLLQPPHHCRMEDLSGLSRWLLHNMVDPPGRRLDLEEQDHQQSEVQYKSSKYKTKYKFKVFWIKFSSLSDLSV